MPDSFGKRSREAKKRQQREMKAERKRLRKAGLLGNENSDPSAPGEAPREGDGSTPPTTPGDPSSLPKADKV